jgi:hypothetical protein
MKQVLTYQELEIIHKHLNKDSPVKLEWNNTVGSTDYSLLLFFSLFFHRTNHLWFGLPIIDFEVKIHMIVLGLNWNVAQLLVHLYYS